METKKEEKPQPEWGQKCSKGCIIPLRIILTLMIHFGLLMAYTNRVSLSVVITKLVVPINRTRDDTKHERACPQEIKAKKDPNDIADRYNWSQPLQGWILGVFYFGYVASHVPGGILVDKFGAKWVISVCMFISATCTLLTPVSLDYGKVYGLMVNRVIMGLAQGVFYPSISALLSNWCPAKERSTLASIAFSGVTLGTVTSNLGSGLMLHDLHWSWVFYVFGMGSILWMILFIGLCYSTPSQHPCIKEKERAYLAETVAVKPQNPNIPWKQIILSGPMWAAVFGQMGHDWGYYVMIAYLPKYMSDVLGFAVKTNGILSSLPFIAMCITTIISGSLADYLVRNGKLSLDLERKLFTFIGGVVPGIFMVAASYVGCDKTIVVVMFVLCLFTMGPYYAGVKLTSLDMSPTFSGTLMALFNGIGSIAGLLAPPIIGAMTPQATMIQWRYVFWLSFGILALSTVIFWVWGTSEVQEYDPKYKPKEK